MVDEKLALNLLQVKYIPAGTIVTVGNFTTTKFTAPQYSSKRIFFFHV